MSKKIYNLIKDCLQIKEGELDVKDREFLRKVIDDLVYDATFGSKDDSKYAKWVVWETAQNLGIYPSSIHDLYMGRGREEIPLDFTVPAINLRFLTFDMARAAFKIAKKHSVGAFIFELARSEMGYTNQTPEEFVVALLGAAIKEGWKGPVFIQGDHIQTKHRDSVVGKPKEGEIETVSKLIKECIDAGFYNIDIDTSTLVDLNEPTETKQQKQNVKYSVKFANLIRENEPKKVTVSIGGEIGHIGGKNSTIEEFNVYVGGFNKLFGDKYPGLSKISVQTGTSHGGVILPDGSVADVDVDFKLLKDISTACRKNHKMGGSVQHGASTLPNKLFRMFVESEVLEIHLSTCFQNLFLDHSKLPKELHTKMYKWLDNNKHDDRKKDWTDVQFYHKTRKHALGHFKNECWDLKPTIKDAIRQSLEKRLEFLFQELNVNNTIDLVNKFIKPVKIHKKLNDFGKATVSSTKV